MVDVAASAGLHIGATGSSLVSIAERVLTILEDLAETDEVRHDLDVRLYDEHLLDSLATVGLMAAFAGEFGIDVAPSELEREQWATPRKIVAFVEHRVGR
jgi:D-alanine--poly(phosphoribitol) ligase subunit 2